MKKRVQIIFLVLFALIFKNSIAQNDPVLMTIAGDKITKSEFESVYHKNNVQKDTNNKNSLKEYLDLYVNFRLKVKEAEDLKLDTLSSFVTELMGYRKQLSQPYLIDKDVNERLIEEAYDRMHFDIRASHILILVPIDAMPKDTLIAYNKIMEIRKKIITGESFEKLAREFSEDPTAKDYSLFAGGPLIKGNNGDLGYFTVFDMIYPFENAAYNTKLGEVSMPIRSDYGYHLLKVTEKKSAMVQIGAAHILIKYPENGTSADSLNAKNKIFELYQKIKNGTNFDTLAINFSDDKGSGAKGGILPPFTVNRMVPEFIAPLYNLKPNEISEPFQSRYGWHIVKMVEKKGVGQFEDLKYELKGRVTRDNRSLISKDIMIEKIKKTYNFKEFPEAKEEFYKILDTNVYHGKWDIAKAKGLNKTIFSLSDKQFSQQDFAYYINQYQGKMPAKEIPSYVNASYKLFLEESCMNYEDSRLEIKYPEFKALMKEYRDGILLFNLTDKRVWSKSVTDTTGLENFYKANTKNYMWGDRLDAVIYYCSDEKIATETRNLLKDSEKKGISKDSILKNINKDSQLNLQIKSGIFSKGDNPVVDQIKWVKGTSKNIAIDKSVVFVVVNKKIDAQPKTLLEAKGLVTADYQNYLEKQWIEELKKKYPVKIYDEVVPLIK
jgi:peptidyl-prolyl cis-trans isomerase SurA